MARIVAALGGNALGDTPAEQREKAEQAAGTLAELAAQGRSAEEIQAICTQTAPRVEASFVIDTLDFLLLHRPDTLVEPEEVAEAFDKLSREGKVKNFGISNHNPYQIELLESALGDRKIVANQLQFSMTNTTKPP